MYNLTYPIGELVLLPVCKIGALTGDVGSNPTGYTMTHVAIRTRNENVYESQEPPFARGL